VKFDPLEHDPEKWKPVFRKDHASPKHDPEEVETGFPEKIMLHQKDRAPIDSI
jgi:hypothetical protein